LKTQNKWYIFEPKTGIDLTVLSTLKSLQKTIHVLFWDVSDHS